MSAAPPRLTVTCRPAHPTDTPAVLALTSRIWEGHDYVPLVWEDWLADRSATLVVAEAEGQIVGLGRLTHLSAFDWWLEGLRVDPAFEGRGVASQIHDHLVGQWLANGAGALRLVTASHRHAVHHLCQRDGFDRLAELNWFSAPARPPARPGSTEPFTPVDPAELPAALRLAVQLDGLRLTGGLMDLLWRWARLRQEYLQASLNEGRLFWWRDRRGILSFCEDYDEPEGEHWPVLQFLGCPVQQIQPYLQDYCSLAAAMGFNKAAWVAPITPQTLLALHAAGFQSEEEHSIYLFAREHPERREASATG